jgi:hypothetical protein
MKHYPIPFNTEMVHAIVEGRKTQTRRVCRHQHWTHSELVDVNKNGITKKVDRNVTCIYGEPGDVLWVREEHLITFSEDRKWITVEFKDGTILRWYYKELSLNLLKKLYRRKTIGKWQRARFLPKELCHRFLRVKSVRVERLQDISEQDAISEGIQQSTIGFKNYDKNYPVAEFIGGGTSATRSFKSLWQSINGAESWDANPWVWVVEFERITKEEAGI